MLAFLSRISVLFPFLARDGAVEKLHSKEKGKKRKKREGFFYKQSRNHF